MTAAPATAAQPRGAFGFTVSSTVPLRYTRPAPDGPVLVVDEGHPPAQRPGDIVAREWTPPTSPLAARLMAGSGTYRLTFDGAGTYEIDPDAARITVPAGVDPLRREERLWGIPALLCFVAAGRVPLHAAAVDVGGSAVVFGGPSKAGKTTLAAACAARGLEVLSEDLVCLGPGPSVLAGPAMIRVRPDTATVMAGAAATVVDRRADRVHHVLDDPAPATPVPLAAIALLHPGPTVTVGPLDPVAGLPDLWTLSFRTGDVADRARSFDALAGLTASVPCHTLRRPRTVAALTETVDALVDLAR